MYRGEEKDFQKNEKAHRSKPIEARRCIDNKVQERESEAL